MWLIFYFEKKYCSRTARKENAFIIQVLTLKEVIKNLFSLLFLWIPNSYNESKLMRTHARNPLIYINSISTKPQSNEWALNSLFESLCQLSCWYNLNMTFFNQKLAFLLLLLTIWNNCNLHDGRYYKPGRSCGILNSIKLLSKINQELIKLGIKPLIHILEIHKHFSTK